MAQVRSEENQKTGKNKESVAVPSPDLETLTGFEGSAPRGEQARKKQTDRYPESGSRLHSHARGHHATTMMVTDLLDQRPHAPTTYCPNRLETSAFAIMKQLRAL